MAMIRDIKEVSYIKVNCNWCDNFEEMLVKNDDLDKYNSKGYLIQECFPYLSPSQRELIISRTCEECWKKMFRNKEE